MPNSPDYDAQLGAVTTKTRAIAHEVLEAAAKAGHHLNQVWGFNPASVPEHSSGRAIDFMVYGDKAAGDWIADYIWSNRIRLGLKWEIWRQRIRSTSSGKSGQWEWMADRGNTTANHYDHVHAFFDDTYRPAQGGNVVTPAKSPNPRMLNVGWLKTARYHDPQQKGRPLGPFHTTVKLYEDMLVDTGWLRPGMNDGHYGSDTVGNPHDMNFGGTMGFQVKHAEEVRGHRIKPEDADGWMGPKELELLKKLANQVTGGKYSDVIIHL